MNKLKRASNGRNMDPITRYENVSPQLATEYLKRNKCNRPLRKGTINRYARDMANDKWESTHQGIAFDRKGYLMDGQHRLYAIIVSGRTIRLPVTRGLPQQANAGVDNGFNRQTVDILHYQGIQADQLSIGCIRWMAFDLTIGRESLGRATRAERIDFYLKHREAISFTVSLFQTGKVIPRARVSSVIGVFARAYYHVKDKTQLERAAEIMRTGVSSNEERDRWLILLRNYLLYLKSIGGETIRIEIYQKAQRALQGFLNNEEVKAQLHPTTKELFPLPDAPKVIRPAPTIDAPASDPAPDNGVAPGNGSNGKVRAPQAPKSDVKIKIPRSRNRPHV